MDKNIPESPTPEYIREEVENQLEVWSQYFKNLSPRIYVYRPRNYDLEILYDRVYEGLKINTNQPIQGWPKHARVVFIVAVDMSSIYDPTHLQFELKDTYIFCFNDYAFGCDYFELLCYEEPPNDIAQPHTYGLDYDQEALSWKYIAKRIRDQIHELQNRIPIL